MFEGRRACSMQLTSENVPNIGIVASWVSFQSAPLLLLNHLLLIREDLRGTHKNEAHYFSIQADLGQELRRSVRKSFIHECDCISHFCETSHLYDHDQDHRKADD